MIPKQLLIAKVILLLALGPAIGYALGVSLAKDVAKAQTITMDEYVAGFDRYKADLESSDLPMPAAVVGGLIMVVGVFGMYELLAIGLAKGLAVVYRGDSAAPSAGG